MQTAVILYCCLAYFVVSGTILNYMDLVLRARWVLRHLHKVIAVCDIDLGSGWRLPVDLLVAVYNALVIAPGFICRRVVNAILFLQPFFGPNPVVRYVLHEGMLDIRLSRGMSLTLCRGMLRQYCARNSVC